MSQKASKPKVLNVSRREDESIADYITRIGTVVHQPSKEEKLQLDVEHHKRLKSLAYLGSHKVVAKKTS